MNHFLRFPTKQSMDEALVLLSQDISVDVIGIISMPTDPVTYLEGWHVNWLGELPDDLKPYEVFPENPVRVWALK